MGVVNHQIVATFGIDVVVGVTSVVVQKVTDEVFVKFFAFRGLDPLQHFRKRRLKAFDIFPSGFDAEKSFVERLTWGKHGLCLSVVTYRKASELIHECWASVFQAELHEE